MQKGGGVWRVNASNRLVQRYKLLACVLPGGIEIVTGTAGVLTGTGSSKDLWRNGYSYLAGAAGSQTPGDIQFTLPDRGYDMGGESTVHILASQQESGLTIRLASVGAGANYIYLTADKKVGIVSGNVVTCGGFTSDHRVYTYARRPGTTTFSVYAAGVLQGTNTASGTQGALTNITIGRGSASNNLKNTRCDFVMVFAGAFDANDALLFALNPYQVVTPGGQRRYWGALVSGVSPVQQDSDLRWNLLAAVQNDSNLRWNMLAAVMGDSNIRWNLIAAIQQDSTLRWNLLSAVLQDSSLVWNLIAAVSGNSDIRWHMAGAISNDSTLQWNLLTTVIQNADLRWGLLNAVQNDAALQWNLLMAAVNNMDLRWNLIAAVSQTYQLVWNVGDGAVINLNVYLVPAGENAYRVLAGDNVFVVAP